MPASLLLKRLLGEHLKVWRYLASLPRRKLLLSYVSTRHVECALSKAIVSRGCFVNRRAEGKVDLLVLVGSCTLTIAAIRFVNLTG